MSAQLTGSRKKIFVGWLADEANDVSGTGVCNRALPSVDRLEKSPVQIEMEGYQERESGSLQASPSLLARRIAGSLIACVSL